MTIEARNLVEELGNQSIVSEGYANECIRKWNKKGLLEAVDKSDPIRNPYVRKVTAMVMENQSNFLKALHEDTLSSNTGYFTKFVFPILRRVWPNLIANQITSVQPMSGPTGAVAYYEKKYDNRKGTKVGQTAVTGVPTATTYTGALAANDNMIQNHAKDYTSEFVSYDAVCTNTGTTSSTLNSASTNCRPAYWGPIRDNGTSGQRTFTVKAYYRILDAGAASADTAIVATMNDSGNFIDDLNSNNVGTFDISTGAWSITPLGTSGTASNFVTGTVVYLQYYVNYELVYQTAGAAIPSASLSISISAITAEKRPIKTQWTVESVDDLRTLHGIDVETDLVETFSNELMMEIDQEIIESMISGAAHAATYTYAATTPGEIETIRGLLTKISAVSARIHKTTLRAPANFIVVSPDVQSLLDQLSTHGDYASIEQDVVANSYGPVTSNMGISRVGTLLRKWAVYVNPFQTAATILVGLKGQNFMDAGFAYCPYVPLQVTPTFMDPSTQTYTKGMFTRYATKMLRPEYYGVITVSGLPTVMTTL